MQAAFFKLYFPKRGPILLYGKNTNDAPPMLDGSIAPFLRQAFM